MSAKMGQKKKLIGSVELRGLEIAPSQVCGAIRLVPLLRTNPQGDLRLACRSYGEEGLGIVSLGGAPLRPSRSYVSYIPHGLVMSWSGNGRMADSAYGTQLHQPERDGKTFDVGIAKVRILSRLVKREGPQQLRLLPMHLAMASFLSLYFSGPDIARSEYSDRALRRGLDPRWETVYGGKQVAGFENALRTFEIHEGQVGVLIFVADALASAFVVPHPDDYRALHQTLISDFYGELVVQYALRHDAVLPFHVTFDDDKIESIADLRAQLGRVRDAWAEFHGVMAQNLLGRPAWATFGYQAGPFTLQQFVTELDPRGENHVGEVIVRDTGELEYLKTYRLSAEQSWRGGLLHQLAGAGWCLDKAAENLQTTRDELVYRLEKAGFGYLIAEAVRVASDKAVRETGRASAPGYARHFKGER